MDTIALFGGSFDPPHIGHEAIVKALQTFKDVDKIIVMPTFLNPFKSKFHAPATLRMEWLKKIFKEYKNVEISDFEVIQKRQVASIDTVKHLLTKYTKIYLVIGADNLNSLDKWQDYYELKKLVSFVVVPRNNIEIPDNFLKLDINEDISSTSLRKKSNTLKLPNICAKQIQKYYKENSCKIE